jgi:ABC-type nitrate/sulfonate/bicarbonate transport system ATPase subunit
MLNRIRNTDRPAVLHQCNLERDLSLFDAGDLTDVGEKGLTLSGGQKARIALARAVYSSAAVLLLDDILAALDVSTSVWIVRKCLNGDLVRGRTVVLVTHSVTLTLPIADYVVSFDADGHITGKDVSLTAHELSMKGAYEEEVVELEEELEREMEEPKTVSSTGAKVWPAPKGSLYAKTRYPARRL